MEHGKLLNGGESLFIELHWRWQGKASNWRPTVLAAIAGSEVEAVHHVLSAQAASVLVEQRLLYNRGYDVPRSGRLLLG